MAMARVFPRSFIHSNAVELLCLVFLIFNYSHISALPVKSANYTTVFTLTTSQTNPTSRMANITKFIKDLMDSTTHHWENDVPIIIVDQL